MKPTKRRSLITLVLLLALVGMADAARAACTETFYLSNSGDGSAPKDGTAAHAFDAADFNTAGNWDTDDQVDSKIGLADCVVVLSGGGAIRANTGTGSTLTFQGSGASGKPIVLRGADAGATTVISGTDAFSAWTQAGNEYYAANLTWAPGAVWIDDTTKLTQGAGVGSLNAQEWVRDGGTNRLYVRLTGNADPTGRVVEAYHRTRAIDLANAAFVTVDNLRLDKAATTAIGCGFSTPGGDNVTISNNDISFTGGLALSVGSSNNDNKPDNWTISGNTIRLWARTTADVAAIKTYKGDGLGGNNLTIYGNTLTLDRTGTNTNGGHGGIQLLTGTDALIERNTITGVEHGIQLVGTGSAGSFVTATIRYNNIHDTTDDGIWFNGTTSAASLTYYNLLINNADNAIDVNTADAGSVSNNTISGSYSESIMLQGAGSKGVFKNNIVAEWGAGANAEAVGIADPVVIANSTFDNNLYYKTGSSNVCHLNYVHKTLAAWKTDAAQDAASLNADPLFLSASNFGVRRLSPAIDAGTDVGLTVDIRGWHLLGTVDIGAYEWHPPVTFRVDGSGVNVGATFPMGRRGITFGER